jgi:predicted nucleic-acid-binding Zn-ribbon protein
MVHWVYVLECEDDRIYVGETIHSFSRWNQHINGSGAKCTEEFRPITIKGLYNLSKNIAFENYRNDNNYNKLVSTFNIDWNEMYTNTLTNLGIENYITECFMNNYDDEWWKVRGGKYTKLIDIEFKYTNKFDCIMNPKCNNSVFYKSKREEMAGFVTPERIVLKINCKKPILNINDRPNCYCGYPAEINLYNNKLYYNCPLKNANKWVNFDKLDLENNCNFYELYNHTHKHTPNHTHKDKHEQDYILQNVECLIDL